MPVTTVVCTLVCAILYHYVPHFCTILYQCVLCVHHYAPCAPLCTGTVTPEGEGVYLGNFMCFILYHYVTQLCTIVFYICTTMCTNMYKHCDSC